MSDTTPRLGLVKPRGDDSMRTDQHNSNMDKMDAVAGAHFMTKAQRQALTAGQKYLGMYVVETDLGGKFDYYWDGNIWVPFTNLPISIAYFAGDIVVPGPANTWHWVKPTNELIDDFSMYDTLTGLWTIQYKGFYELSGRCSIGANAATGTLGVRFTSGNGSVLYVNGERIVVQNPSHLMHTMGKGVCMFNVGETLRVEYSHGHTGDQGFNGGFAHNSFSVRMVARNI